MAHNESSALRMNFQSRQRILGSEPKHERSIVREFTGAGTIIVARGKSFNAVYVLSTTPCP
jgi:hypothetical protein